MRAAEREQPWHDAAPRVPRRRVEVGEDRAGPVQVGAERLAEQLVARREVMRGGAGRHAGERGDAPMRDGLEAVAGG